MAVDVRIRGRDGKTYPEHRATDAERDRVVHLVHKLRCEHHLSIRAIVEELPKYGINRSRGAISRDLQLYWCKICGPR